MLIVRSVKNWLLLLRRNWKFALLGLIVGAAAWQAIARYAPKRYTGSALITLNLSLLSLNSPANSGEQKFPVRDDRTAERECLARRLGCDREPASYPYPELQTSSGAARVAAYLASRVSIEPVPASEIGSNVARISYTGDSRETVSGVVGDIADAFVKPTLRLNAAPAEAAAVPESAPLIAAPPAVEPAAAPMHLSRRARLHERRWQRRHGGVATLPAVAATPVGNQIAKPETASPAAGNAAAIDHALQVSLSDGVKLQDALAQSTSSVTRLLAQADDQQKRVSRRRRR